MFIWKKKRGMSRKKKGRLQFQNSLVTQTWTNRNDWLSCIGINELSLFYGSVPQQRFSWFFVFICMYLFFFSLSSKTNKNNQNYTLVKKMFILSQDNENEKYRILHKWLHRVISFNWKSTSPMNLKYLLALLLYL